MITAIFGFKKRRREASAGRRLHAEIERICDRIPVDFAGGCSLEKALLMAELIRRCDLRVTLDIGVLRGRSLFPQALAHRGVTGGVVYGIDPWTPSESREYDTPALRDKIDSWIDATDHQVLYQGVASLVKELHLERHCVILRRTSAEAISFFEEKDIRFDMIHIDGNHDTEKVLRDVRLYAPRVKDNGFVVFDDVSWDSTGPAFRELEAAMQLLFRDKDRMNDYALFLKGSSTPGARHRRHLARRVRRGVKQLISSNSQ